MSKFRAEKRRATDVRLFPVFGVWADPWDPTTPLPGGDLPREAQTAPVAADGPVRGFGVRVVAASVLVHLGALVTWAGVAAALALSAAVAVGFVAPYGHQAQQAVPFCLGALVLVGAALQGFGGFVVSPVPLVVRDVVRRSVGGPAFTCDRIELAFVTGTVACYGPAALTAVLPFLPLT